MNRILIINPFGIGDVLFTTPVIRAIKDSLPGSYVGYWCNKRVLPVLENNPHIDKIYALSRGDIKKVFRESFFKGLGEASGLIRGLKKGRFDISLDFSLDHRYSLISKFLGIRRRIGYNYKNRGRFLTESIPLAGYDEKHIVEYYLELIKLLGIEAQDKKLELKVRQQDKIKAENFLKGKGINTSGLVIGIAPGAGESWGNDSALKHWPVSKFAQLADKITEELGAQVLLFGNSQERGLAEMIISKARRKPLDLVGVTTLAEFIALLDNVNLLIANDGGPLHLAAALGKKTVSLFGPVDPEVYGPFPPDEKKHRVLFSALDCRPCYRNFRLADCLKGKDCLEKIEVETVFKAVSSLLN